MSPPTVDPAELALRFAVKKELRKRMRGVRAALTEDAASTRSARIVAALLALPEVRAAETLCVFWPMVQKREVDLRALVADARARGQRVAYPWMDRAGGPPRFRVPASDDALVPGSLGELGPTDDAPELAPGSRCVIIVPALALDPTGHRIGYGGAVYDRLLAAYAPPAIPIGVAYDFQLIGEVPVTDGDAPVATIVTDERVLTAGIGATVTTEGPSTTPTDAGVRTVVRPGPRS